MSDQSRILLVDDEPDFVEAVKDRLEAGGYEVITAGDGQQALDQVKQAKPDLIILDLMLPKIDGYKVCRLLKFDKRTQAIPILIFTARAQTEDTTMATECGADAYLTKPFDPKTLLSKMEELLPKTPSP